MISDTAGVTELVRDIARGHESLARSQSEDLVSDDGLQFAGEDKICLILARMCMTRHTLPGRDSQIDEAVCSSRVFAREKDRTKGDVKVITLRLRLIFNGGGDVRHSLKVTRIPPLSQYSASTHSPRVSVREGSVKIG